MRNAIRIGAVILISALILAGIIVAVGFEQTAEAVARAGVVSFAAVGGLLVLSLLVHTIAWAALNRPIGHAVPFLKLLRASVIGRAGNIVTPSTYLGGEPLRVLYVGQAGDLPYHEVAGSVLLGKYLEAISFILFAGITAGIALVRYRASLFGPNLAVGVLLVVFAIGLLVMGAVLWVSLLRRQKPLTALAGSLSRLPIFPHRMSRFRVRVRSMEEQAARVFCEEPKVAWRVFGMHVLGHVAIFLKPAVFFYLGGALVLDIGQLSLLFVVGQILLMVQLMPSGAGILDGGYLGAFALMGLGDSEHLAQCMAYLLCLRFWDILMVGSGAFFASRAGIRLLFSRSPGRGEAPSPVEGTRDAG